MTDDTSTQGRNKSICTFSSTFRIEHIYIKLYELISYVIMSVERKRMSKYIITWRYDTIRYTDTIRINLYLKILLPILKVNLFPLCVVYFMRKVNQSMEFLWDVYLISFTDLLILCIPFPYYVMMCLAVCDVSSLRVLRSDNGWWLM